ncbi:prophage protein [Shigella sonnei]|nr:prophage protein [Shigella sonnei]
MVASRLGISREDAVNELWKLKRRGEADNKGSMWWLIQAGESEPVSPVPKVTAQMLTEAIEQHGPQTADELALMFGITSRRANSSLAMAISKGRLIRVNQGGKFRYCIPGADLPAEPKAASIAETDGKVFPQPAGVALPVQEAATQEEIKTETVADIVQSLPSFTETQADDLVLPSLHMANRELRRAKSHVQKWERVCAALRELNKHRDIVRQIVDSSGRIVSEK